MLMLQGQCTVDACQQELHLTLLLLQVVLFERAFASQLAFQAHGHHVAQLVCLRVSPAC